MLRLLMVFLSFFVLFFSKCGEETQVNIAACDLTPETGRCRAAIPKYYWDAEACACKEFIWGGCGGVVPFDSLEECEVCACL